MVELVTRCRAEMPELRVALTGSNPESAAVIFDLPLEEGVQRSQIDTSAAEQIPEISADLVIWAGSADGLYPIPLHIKPQRLILVDVTSPAAGRFGRRSWSANQRTNLQSCARAFARNREAVEWMTNQGTSPSKISQFGPLCPGVVIPSCNEDKLTDYADLISARPIWLCTSFDDSERDLILNAHRMAVRSAHRMLLVVSPSDNTMGAAIADWFDAEGMKAGCASRGEAPDPETQVFVADGADDLSVWFRLATISYMGGSLMSVATENPYWPAALGSVVVHGPKTGRHADLFQRLSEGKASVALSDPDALGVTIKDLQSPQNAAELAHNAWMVTSAGADLIDALVEDVLETIDMLGERS